MRWVLRRAAASGITRVRHELLTGSPHSRSYWLGKSATSLWRAVVRGKGTLLVGLFRRDPQKLVLASTHAGTWLGASLESAKLAIRNPRPRD